MSGPRLRTPRREPSSGPRVGTPGPNPRSQKAKKQSKGTDRLIVQLPGKKKPAFNTRAWRRTALNAKACPQGENPSLTRRPVVATVQRRDRPLIAQGSSGRPYRQNKRHASTVLQQCTERPRRLHTYRTGW